MNKYIFKPITNIFIRDSKSGQIKCAFHPSKGLSQIWSFFFSPSSKVLLIASLLEIELRQKNLFLIYKVQIESKEKEDNDSPHIALWKWHVCFFVLSQEQILLPFLNQKTSWEIWLFTKVCMFGASSSHDLKGSKISVIHEVMHIKEEV